MPQVSPISIRSCSLQQLIENDFPVVKRAVSFRHFFKANHDPSKFFITYWLSPFYQTLTWSKLCSFLNNQVPLRGNKPENAMSHALLLRSIKDQDAYTLDLNFFLTEDFKNMKTICLQDDRISSEYDNDHLVSNFGVCAACKLAINHYRNFNFSAFNFLSVRSNTCPFCGLRYRDSASRQTAENDDTKNVEENKEVDFPREQRSSSDPTVPRYRLPPIVSI